MGRRPLRRQRGPPLPASPAVVVAAPALLRGPGADASGSNCRGADRLAAQDPEQRRRLRLRTRSQLGQAMTRSAVPRPRVDRFRPAQRRLRRRDPVGYFTEPSARSRHPDVERRFLLLRRTRIDPTHFLGHDLVGPLVARRASNSSFSSLSTRPTPGSSPLEAAGVTSDSSTLPGSLHIVPELRRRLEFRREGVGSERIGTFLQRSPPPRERRQFRHRLLFRGVQRSGGGFALASGPVTPSRPPGPPGAARGGSLPRGGAKRRDAAQLPGLGAVGGRPLPLLVEQRPDPGLGTGQALMAVNGAAFPLGRCRGRFEPRQLRQRRRGWRRRRRGRGSGPKSTAKGRAAGTAPAASQDPGQQQSVPLAPASSSDSGGGGGGVPGWLIAVGIVALGAAVVWGGWIRYRRRLPSV